MNLIKENQTIKIVPDAVSEITTGIITSATDKGFIAKVDNTLFAKSCTNPEILISSEAYLLKFQTSIDKIESGNVYFSIPEKLSYIQKREYPRIECKIPVLLFIKSDHENIKAVIVNIGGGGMQVSGISSNCCADTFCINMILKANFNISPKNEITTTYKLLRINNENGILVFSGSFGKISNADKTAIVQYCFKRQLEMKLKNQESV